MIAERMPKKMFHPFQYFYIMKKCSDLPFPLLPLVIDSFLSHRQNVENGAAFSGIELKTGLYQCTSYGTA